MVAVKLTGLVVPLALTLALSAAPDRPLPDVGAIDPLVAAIREIEETPSLCNRLGRPRDIANPALVSREKTADLIHGQELPLKTEQARWRANRKKYESAHPLRAACFAVWDAAAVLRDIEPPTFIVPAEMTPDIKDSCRDKQDPLGIALFKLERIIAQVEAADAQRDEEPSRRWRARYDWMRVCFESDLVFLIEYNFALAEARMQWDFPELAAGDEGWHIESRPKPRATEVKAKSYYKSMKKRLKRMQEEYADTPWGLAAERENERELGLAWMAKKE